MNQDENQLLNDEQNDGQNDGQNDEQNDGQSICEKVTPDAYFYTFVGALLIHIPINIVVLYYYSETHNNHSVMIMTILIILIDLTLNFLFTLLVVFLYEKYKKYKINRIIRNSYVEIELPLINDSCPPQCPICLAIYAYPGQIIKLKLCNHIFHRQCIYDWFRKNPNCPICRQSYN